MEICSWTLVFENDDEQIKRLLRNSRQFNGVFSSDTLSASTRLLVCNPDPSHRKGTHWICIYVGENRSGEYFDSLGHPPNKTLERYMNVVCSSWTYNSRQLQSVLSALWSLLRVLLYTEKYRLNYEQYRRFKAL